MSKMSSLTKKELTAQNAFLKRLVVRRRKTKKPLVVGTIGLVGSGKSSVARELAKHIGATVIEGDVIRIELRKQNERYDRVRVIAENVAAEVLKRGGNVIIDSDFIDARKRATLRDDAHRAGARVAFVCVYCDPDVMIARIIAAYHRNREDDFFGGVRETTVTGSMKGAVVKIREMWRRTPHHYRWQNKDGGRWVIKQPPAGVVADIDTTDSKKWKVAVSALAKKLLKH